MVTFGDYELLVTINSFSNPGGMCASSNCANMCCDGDCPSSCHYYFSLCQRPAGTPVSTLRRIGEGNCVTNNTLVSSAINGGSSFTDNVFGVPNPINFTGAQWVSIVYDHSYHWCRKGGGGGGGAHKCTGLQPLWFTVKTNGSYDPAKIPATPVIPWVILISV